MATNAKERLLNHEDGQGIIKELNGIKTALLAGAASGGETTVDGLLANIRNGTAPTNFPIGTELTFSAEPTISTFQGNTQEGTSSGVTGVTVDKATYISKAGSGSSITAFYYDGSAWHLGSVSGSVVTLPEYGVTVQGTPIAGDYVTVSLSAAEYVFQVAGYDHYEPANPNVKHTMALIAKDLIKESQQYSDGQMAMACSKKAMPVGKYKFTAYRVGAFSSEAGYKDNGNGTYVFTTTKQIPQNGGWSHTKFGDWNPPANFITTGTITTYDADGVAIESGIAVAAYNEGTDSDAVDLGTIVTCDALEKEYPTANMQNEFGYLNVISSRLNTLGSSSSDYATSIVRQWLTADQPAGKWWKKMSIFDVKPASGWTDQRDGFLYGLDPELKKAIVKVKVISPLNQGQKLRMNDASASVPVEWLNVENGSISSNAWTYGTIQGDCEVVEDGVFLPSYKELGGTINWITSYEPNNSALSLYDGASDADRIKTYDDEPSKYWTRSLCAWLGSENTAQNWHYSSTAIDINLTGSNVSDGNSVIRAEGIAPVIVIG